MKKKTLLVIVMVITVCLSITLLAGCKADDVKPESTENEESSESDVSEEGEPEVVGTEDEGIPEESETEDEETGEDLKEIVLTGYREVLESLSSYESDFVLPVDVALPIDYALEDISRDGVPELLVGTSDDLNPAVRYVPVFYFDFKDRTVKMAEGYLVHGVASAGGFRGSLGIAENENGYSDLYESAWSSGSGEGETFISWLEDGTLQHEYFSSFKIGEDNDVRPETREIVWVEIANMDYLATTEMDLEALRKAQEAADSQPEESGTDTDVSGGESASDDIDALIADAQNRGLQVFEGTFLVMTGDKLAEYENMDVMLNGEWGAEMERKTTYVILELDEPQNVSGNPADGSPTHTTTTPVTHIGITWRTIDYDNDYGNGDDWYEYDGKHGIIATDLWFQSDASFPFAPRCINTELIHLD